MYTPINGWTKEKILKHIRAEFKGKSVGDIGNYTEGKCLYRGPNGTKCAVGMFIPDDKYHEDMEHSVTTAVYEQVEEFMPLPLVAMYQLQGRHDESKRDHTLLSITDWVDNNVSDM